MGEDSKRIKCCSCGSWFTLLKGKKKCTVCGGEITGDEDDSEGGVDPIKEVI